MRYSPAMTADIASPSNERIKNLVRLRDRKHRDESHTFIVEGERLLTRALSAGLTPFEVFTTDPNRWEQLTNVVSVEESILSKASYRQSSEGVIAVFDQFSTDLRDLDTKPDPLLLVAEGIEKPGNLGAMLRSADAVGADAMIVVGQGVDVFNPNVIRSSTGALFVVPLASSGLEELVPWLTSRSVRLLVAAPKGQPSLWKNNLRGGVALMVGSEDGGVSDAARSAADDLITIPMLGRIDSLNAATTLAILGYEALRQRQAKSSDN